jgi:hypothetical protein
MRKKKALPPGEDDKVRLKSVLGLRPGVYLAAIYGFIILIILFFLFLQPGIFNPGSVLAVGAEPQGAAIRVDGVYMASAPCEIFVSTGSRKIEAVLPGFTPEEKELTVGSRLLGSRFFPLKIPVEFKLDAKDPAGAFRETAGEFAAWTFAGEATVSYQVPLSLSEGAYRLGPGAKDMAVFNSMEKTLSSSVRFAVTRSALRDLVRAKFLLDNQGLSPSPLTLAASVRDMLNFLGENSGSSVWLGSVLPEDAVSIITESSWYTREIASASALRESSGAAVESGGATTQGQYFGGLRFQELPPGRALITGTFPMEEEIDGFYIAETPVTRAAWEAFMEDEAFWRPDRREALIAEGLVNPDYLKTWNLEEAPPLDSDDSPFPGMSWFAARAFCQWLSAGLPKNLGLEARLPREAEWEYAAKAGAFTPGLYWEWCEDPFAPMDIFPSAGASFDPPSPERSVRGGSWVNRAGSVSPDTRASLPPDSCSPFVSFRPVLTVLRTGAEKDKAAGRR